MELGRVDSTDVAVEEWDESPLADTIFAKIHIGVKFAAEPIQVSTIFCISWITIVVKLGSQ